MLVEGGDAYSRGRLVDWIGRKGGSGDSPEVQMGCRWLHAAGDAEAAWTTWSRLGSDAAEAVSTTSQGGGIARLSTVRAIAVDETQQSQRQNVGSVDVTALTPEPPAGGGGNL